MKKFTAVAITFLLVSFTICGCGKRNQYNKAKADLIGDGKRVQVLAQASPGGMIYISDKKIRSAYDQVEKTFKSMCESEEIVSLFTHKISDFQITATILAKLSDAHIQIYVEAAHLYAGIPDGGVIYVAKKDEVKAEEILKELKK